jgi:hypothetical protein
LFGKNTASLDGAGASQMHKGIPHLHSTVPITGIFSAVDLGFESATVPISNDEKPSVSGLTPSKEADVLLLLDLSRQPLLKQSEQTLTHE